MKTIKTTHFSRSVAVSLATLFAAATSAPVFAGVMHTDVAIQTYTDFGQNMGRYTTSSNALLDHIREKEGGVRINYTGGQDSYVLEHGLIDFESTGDNGALSALGYNFIATVRHNGVQNPTFTGRLIGNDNAIHYATIERRYGINQSNTAFSLSPTNDYKIARTSKLITDVSGSAVYSRPEKASEIAGQMLYRAGAGTHELSDYTGKTSRKAGAYLYITGGITKINSATDRHTVYPKDRRGISDDSVSVGWTLKNWSSSGINENNPLPTSVRSGDSGSPGWVWNNETGRYEYLAAGQSYGGHFSQSRGATQWTIDTMNSFDKHVDMSKASSAVVTINSVDSRLAWTTVSCELHNVSATPNFGNVTDAKGKELALFSGVQAGTNTWHSLSNIKNNQNWYSYGNNYLNSAIPYEKLFLTENLVFDAAHAETTINIGPDISLGLATSDVDLGIGYVRFTAGERDSAKFTVRSAFNRQLNSAGYIVDKNVDAYVTISNRDANYMREWRKVGEGNLHIAGTGGNNEIFLNVGGNGKTYLLQSGGYAAYNVLANNGSTVVIKDTNQIARDFTFGAGGGVLDMNGNSMAWYYTNNNPSAAGFSINALTEEAIIANNKGNSVLTFKQGGAKTFVGSFRDTENSSLKIVYDAGRGSSWTLNSVYTNLQNDASGLEVKSGAVSLVGTNTVHAIGSATGTSAARYFNENDWHYADAKMDVSVASGAEFRLGSHARLTGDVSVASGGVFVMNEGVKHQQEYIEGGLTLEDTYAISDFYGLKGNVALAANAEMRVQYGAGTTANTTYSGRISGEGAVKIALGEAAQTFTLSGDNSGFSGNINVESGRLVLGSDSVFRSSAGISVGQNAAMEVSVPVSDHTTFDMSRVSGNGTLSLKLADGNGRGFNLSAFTGTIEVGKHDNSSIGRLRLNTSDLNTAATIKVLSGGELVFDGTGTNVANNVVLTSDTKIHANHRKDGEISGKISGSSNVTLTKSGFGILTLSGNNSGFSGNINVESGHLVFKSASAFSSSARISVGQNAAMEVSVPVSDHTTFDMSRVSGNGTLSLKLADGNGRGFNLSAFTGTIEVGKHDNSSIGRLRLNTSDLNTAATIKVLSGGELVFDGTGTNVANNVVLTSDTKIHANHRKDGEISGKISGNSDVTLTKAGAGILTLSGDNSGFSGDIVVISGVLKVTDIAALGSGDVLVKSGATLELSVEDVSDFSAVTLAAGATLKLLGEQVDATLAGLTRQENADGIVSLTAQQETVVILGTDGKLSINGETEAPTSLSVDAKVPLAGLRMLRSAGVSQSALSVPEPSAFGLLAGLGAIALAVSRRRRTR